MISCLVQEEYVLCSWSGVRATLTCFVSQRICPGKHLAVTSIVSAMSTCATLLSSRLVLTTVQTLNAMNFLWAFNFLPAKDPHTGERKKIDLNDAEDVRPFFLPWTWLLGLIVILFSGTFLKTPAIWLWNRTSELRKSGDDKNPVCCREVDIWFVWSPGSHYHAVNVTVL